MNVAFAVEINSIVDLFYGLKKKFVSLLYWSDSCSLQNFYISSDNSLG